MAAALFNYIVICNFKKMLKQNKSKPSFRFYDKDFLCSNTMNANLSLHTNKERKNIFTKPFDKYIKLNIGCKKE